MDKKILIIHMPVLHRGYLEFLNKEQNKISQVFLISDVLQKELSEFNPDIAAVGADSVAKLLQSIGYNDITVVSAENVSSLKNEKIILIQDEISRNLYDKYLQGADVEWVSVFLRWDKKSVMSETAPSDITVSGNAFDQETMKIAYQQAENTGDWWRQIGAVVVKDGNIVLKGWNRDLPSDHTAYQVGEARDFFKAGERPDIANTIHAEQNVIAQAAKVGIGLEGAALYVTHFPCPVCAKLVACSGIKYLFFAEGSAVFDGRKILESAGVEIVCVRY